VARSMPRSGFDDDRSIAEDIVVGVREDHRFAVAELTVSGLIFGLAANIASRSAA
jgi:hypothetical protein